MNKPEKENLSRLLPLFMDADSAKRAASDIEKGDELFRKWPAPQPNETFLAEVKQRMVVAAGRRRVVSLQHKFLVAAAVAAAILVLSAVALKVFENPSTGQSVIKYATIPDKIWEGGDIMTDDPDIAVLAAEIETIANEMSGAELSDTSGNGNTAVGDVETELIEIGGDFWKG